MSGHSALAEAFAALGEILDAEGVGWYVFGAQAASAYGSPRLTADIDVTIAIPLEKAGNLAHRMAEAGFEPRVPDIDAVVARTRVIPVTHNDTGIPVDLVVAGPGLEEDFLERARTVELEGVPVRMIAPEDLVVTKILAGRPKDREDVLGILRERLHELDMDLMRRTLRLLDEALSRGDLVVELESMVGEIQGG